MLQIIEPPFIFKNCKKSINAFHLSIPLIMIWRILVFIYDIARIKRWNNSILLLLKRDISTVIYVLACEFEFSKDI